MRLLPRRKHDCPGILLRISTPDGVVVEASSWHLYCSAKFAGVGDGWLNLITAADPNYGPQCPAEEFSTVPLKIEIKAARLTDA